MTRTRKPKLPKLYKRRWINKGEGTAYVVIDAKVEGHWDEGKFPEDRHIEADVEIKDCSRQVTLEFSCWSMKEYKERLVKLQGIIDDLEGLIRFMVANPPVERKGEDG